MDWTVSLWAKWDENFKMSFQFRDGNGFSGMKRMTQYQTRKTRVNFLPNMWSSIPCRVFYYWNTLDYLITPVFGSHSEVYYKVDRLLTNLTAQQSSSTARWDSNKTTPSRNPSTCIAYASIECEGWRRHS